MASISVRLPVTLDDTFGFGMITTVQDMIRQNLLMLVLTNPEERTMVPDYGVGITQFLFENANSDVYARIDAKIRQQAKEFMTMIVIEQVNFYSIEADSNKVSLRIVYSIPSIAANDILEITI
tara:strand:- start:404 stop:772 length:369 start_codon:yes stop_codon:yes gene_type:complete